MTAYLDHAATTPMLSAAVDAFTAELDANRQPVVPAHRRTARAPGRGGVARAVGGRPGGRAERVVFTGGGTEADNLAVKGMYWQRHDADPRRRRVVASAVEHHAVLDPLVWLARHDGAQIDWIGVDAAGRLDLDAYRAALRRSPESIALVSVMWANNEVGTLQPIAEVVEAAHEVGVPVHSDAVQAVGAVPVDFGASGVDALSVSGHKIGGPVGTGALLLRRGLDLVPVLHGGGQERGVRSGTLDAASIRAFAVAAGVAVEAQPRQAARLAALRDDLTARVLAEVPDAVVRGDPTLPVGCPASRT